MNVTPAQLVSQVYLRARQGSLQLEILATPRRGGGGRRNGACRRTARRANRTTTFLARWPDNVTASIGLANSYYTAGDLNAAEAVLRRALARHPDSDAAMNNLAQALSDEGRDDEALALIERAVALAGPYAQIAQETREIIVQRRASKQ